MLRHGVEGEISEDEAQFVDIESVPCAASASISARLSSRSASVSSPHLTPALAAKSANRSSTQESWAAKLPTRCQLVRSHSGKQSMLSRKKFMFVSTYLRACQSNGRLFMTPRVAARPIAFHPEKTRYGALLVRGVWGGTMDAMTVRELVRFVTSRNASRAPCIGWVLGSRRTSGGKMLLKTLALVRFCWSHPKTSSQSA